MRISRIGIYQVDLPLTAPCRLSGERLYVERLDATLVRLDADEGLSGWGEGSARNEVGATRAPGGPGLGVWPRLEIPGQPRAVFET